MTHIPNFPVPTRIYGATRWRLSDLVEHEAGCRGEPAPEELTPSEERYLSVSMVAKRLGVSRRTVWRWVAQADRANAQRGSDDDSLASDAIR